MTYEEIKDLLRNIRSKKSRLKALKAYIDEERSLIIGVGAVCYDNVTVDNSRGNSTEERYIKYIDRLNDLQQHYDLLREDLDKEEIMLFDRMSILTATEYEVILNRFFRGYKPLKTAKLMGYSLDGLYDIQERAIKKMAKFESSQ